MSESFNVLMCKFYKFYICAIVGIIIELVSMYKITLNHVRGDHNLNTDHPENLGCH